MSIAKSLKDPDTAIGEARRIAETYEQDQVILVSWERSTGMVHVATYGKSLEDSVGAAQAGNAIKKDLSFPDHMCHEVPVRVQQLKAAFLTAVQVIRRLHMASHDSGTDVQLERSWNTYYKRSPEMAPIREQVELLEGGK